MKSKKFPIILFLLYSVTFAVAGNLHDGFYLCETNYYGIIVKQDSVFIVRASNVSHCNGWDTIAKASYKYINDEFILLEATTTQEYLKAESYTVSEDKVGMLDTSIEICTPNYDGCLQITYLDNNCNVFEVVNNSVFSCKQENTKSKFCFEIMNPHPEYNVDGTSWATFSYFLSVKIDRSKNHHKIVLPNVTEKKLRLIEVNNDFIRVAKNELSWRGITFKKSRGTCISLPVT